MSTFQYFEKGHWKFVNSKIFKVLEQMSKEEHEEFDCDIRKIHWPKYFENYQRGI